MHKIVHVYKLISKYMITDASSLVALYSNNLHASRFIQDMYISHHDELHYTVSGAAVASYDRRK